MEEFTFKLLCRSKLLTEKLQGACDFATGPKYWQENSTLGLNNVIMVMSRFSTKSATKK